MIFKLYAQAFDFLENRTCFIVIIQLVVIGAAGHIKRQLHQLADNFTQRLFLLLVGFAPANGEECKYKTSIIAYIGESLASDAA
jgi:hypothetical protein